MDRRKNSSFVGNAFLLAAVLLSGCAGSAQKSTVSEWLASVSSEQIDYKIIRTKTKNTQKLDR